MENNEKERKTETPDNDVRKELIFDTTTFEALRDGDDGESFTDSFPAIESPINLAGLTVTPTSPSVEKRLPRKEFDSEESAKTEEKKKGPKSKEPSALEMRREIRKKEALRRKRRKTTNLDRLNDDAVSANGYYLNFSKKYMIAFVVTFILGLIFTVTVYSAFSSVDSEKNKLSVDNFKYFMNDIDFSSLSSGSFGTMVFNGDANALFGVYRGDLVVVKQGNTSLYKTSGAAAFSIENEYYSPVLETSKKYFLVYDMGNTSYSYSIYNSFSSLKSETYDFPITYGAVSDSGVYALLTRDENYKTVINVYGTDLSPALTVKKEKYTVCLDISPDGKTLYTVALYDISGQYATEIDVIDIESTVEKTSAIVEDSVPMKICALENGNIAVTYTDRVCVYDGEECIEISSYKPTSSTLANAYFSRDVICMTCNNSVIGDDKDVRIISPDGKEKFRLTISGELLKTTSNDGDIYMLFRDRTVKIDGESGKISEADVEPNGIDIVFSSNGTAYICYSGELQALEFVEEAEQ